MVDWTSNINDCHEYLIGVKGGRCVGLTTWPPSCPTSGTLRSCLYFYTVCPTVYRISRSCVVTNSVALVCLSHFSFWQCKLRLWPRDFIIFTRYSAAYFVSLFFIGLLPSGYDMMWYDMIWYDMIRYICYLQLCWHPVAIVQYTFTTQTIHSKKDNETECTEQNIHNNKNA